MPGPTDEAVRDVTLLMMVRVMPDADFRRMCDGILKGDPSTSVARLGCGEYLNPGELKRTEANVGERLRPCDCCGGPVVVDGATYACEAASGLLACKTCIDGALFTFFGPDDGEPLDPSMNFIARHVLERAALGRHA
jgi:hypothetical protein